MITLFVGKCKDGIHRQRPTYAVYGGDVSLEPTINSTPESELIGKEQSNSVRRKGGDKAGQKRRSRAKKRQAKRAKLLGK